jgi:hypothetical protein
MAGFEVSLTIMKDEGEALVEITVENGTILLDTILVPLSKGYEVYSHTALYSDALRTMLDRRPAPLPEADGSDEEPMGDEEEIPF